jgi:hypothetical protein
VYACIAFLILNGSAVFLPIFMVSMLILSCLRA